MKSKFVILFLLVSGCAYYNTYYNADEYYKKALASTPPNKDYLEKSIQKCEKLITYYPKSKWVPDAMFLMGKCFVQKEDYEYAITKFKEIISYYPTHKLADKSRVELANAYIEQGDYIKAKDAIKDIKGYQEDATSLIIETYFMSGEYDTAIKIAKDNIPNIRNPETKASLYNLIGSSYDSLGQYESAITNYGEALKLQPKNLQLVTDMSNTYLRLNQPEKALDKLLKYNEVLTEEQKIELDLMVAKCYKNKGDFDKAIETLEKNKTTAKTIYEIGIIYEENLKNLEKAKEYYEQARTSGDNEIANQSLMRASRIDKLLEYKKEVAKISAAKDTTGAVKSDTTKSDTMLAVPDSVKPDTKIALKPDTVKTTTATIDTVKKPYVNSDIDRRTPFQLPVASSPVFTPVDSTATPDITRPDKPGAMITPKTDTTKLETNPAPKDTAKTQDLGKSQFLLAELYFFEFKKIDEAIVEYEKVITDFPKSEYAPKSAYAIGWILENEKSDTIKAISAYEKVIQNYPNSAKYVGLANEGIVRLQTKQNESLKKR